MRFLHYLPLCFVVMLASCGSHSEAGKLAPQVATVSTSDSVSAAPPEEQNTKKVTGGASAAFSNAAGSPAVAVAPSPEKKVILTADFKCRVKDIFASVKQLEHITKALGGEVQESNMENELGETKTINVNDSNQELHFFSTRASLVLRVPAAQFDSVVHALPELADFIESRTIRENNVTLRYYGNKLRAETSTRRLEEMKGRLPGKSDGTRLEEYKDRKDEERTNHQLENMGIADDVAFASVSVTLTQPNRVYTTTVFNAANIDKGHFGANCVSAIKEGAEMFQVISVGLLTVWPLWIITAGLVYAFRVYRKRIIPAK